MAERESSPQAAAAALARLAELHRQECAPGEFHGRVAQRIAALASAKPQAQTGARRRASRQRLAWVPLLAAVAAILVWVFAPECSIIPVREVTTRPSSALPARSAAKQWSIVRHVWFSLSACRRVPSRSNVPT